MNEWTETRLPEDRCPHCDAKLDAASSATGATPSPGDLTVCIHCALPLIFDSDCRLCVMTPADMRRLDLETAGELRRYMAAVRQTDRRSAP